MKKGARRGPGRVMLGLTEVAGYYAGLQTALRKLGVDATLVTAQDHPFKYGGEADNALLRVKRALVRRLEELAAERAGTARRLPAKLANRGVDLLLLAWAATRFDTFVFGFGTTFTGRPQWELPLLRALGKRVVCVFHGSDARPPYLDGAVMATGGGRTIADCVRASRTVRSLVAHVDAHAHAVVNNPLSGHFHQRPCVSWYALGLSSLPADARKAAAAGEERPAGAPVRVLHSPSHPEAKGTPLIRGAVENLRARGLAIELVELLGRPNAEVVAELERCDFVVDQAYSDTPMATFAAEAARRGKPAVVGGYGADAFRQFIPPRSMPPSEYCRPEEMEAAIERLATDAAYRLQLGARARAFVARRWSTERVARRLLRVMEGRIPRAWLFDPAQIRYVHGGGLPEARARTLVREVVALGGPAALQLDDKPALRERLLAFARGAAPE
ncbi:MAG TPA: hypothetical protein VFT45_13205 [Longimicrobium sp.]|nr:hypothetical protein [Longimicrobium sp.]